VGMVLGMKVGDGGKVELVGFAKTIFFSSHLALNHGELRVRVLRPPRRVVAPPRRAARTPGCDWIVLHGPRGVSSNWCVLPTPYWGCHTPRGDRFWLHGLAKCRVKGARPCRVRRSSISLRAVASSLSDKRDRFSPPAEWCVP
jgi:hypothetical protein